MSEVKIIDKRWGYIGDNTSDNNVGTNNVLPNADGSILERLEELDQNIATGAGQRIFTKSVTSAANSGTITIGTVSGGSIFIEAIILKTNSNTTADFTTGEIKGGPTGNPTVLTFFDTIGATFTNLDSTGEQLAWIGKAHLEPTDRIIQNLVGTGATAVNFSVIVAYRPVDGTNGIIS